MTANPSGAVEVTDVDSAAKELAARFAARSEPAQEKPEEIEEEVTEEVEAVADTEEIESEEESDQQEPEAEEAAPRFETLEELAEATGMELDEFLSSVKGKVKINGEESEITLAEMREGQQREADYRRKTMQLAEERKALQAEQAEAQTKLTAEFQKTGSVLAMAQQELTSEFNNVNWQQLQQDNPSEFVMKRQQFGERQARINQAIEQATQQAEAFRDRQTEQQSQSDNEYLQEQHNLLVDRLPTWKDSTVRNAETSKVTEYLTDLGFKPEEIGNIKDHRYILMARDAMAGKKTASAIDIAKKKVKKIPKLVKPNARQNVNQSQERVKKLEAKARKTGHVDDVAQALLARRSK